MFPVPDLSWHSALKIFVDYLLVGAGLGFGFAAGSWAWASWTHLTNLTKGNEKK